MHDGRDVTDRHPMLSVLNEWNGAPGEVLGGTCLERQQSAWFHRRWTVSSHVVATNRIKSGHAATALVASPLGLGVETCSHVSRYFQAVVLSLNFYTQDG